ncbi:TetR family transcriptional regulator [Actinomycetospora corticicola]|uniref:AcrR family transcriptional regulator n=1 Tax=Actinomycetospora corticicola TaxID=663602 RepID=A0A7Y9DUQ2_9PSEU|nr:TetR family transcriptional regulator [Actinomycetospora corticicola]NYD35771.1 AcrR family transcriptional regulator [Actinomycetospora corticicola]
MRTPGQRAGLSRPAVVTAARAVLDEGASFSMRAVAGRLGVAPNALYSHVDGRDGLLDAVLDDLLGALPSPANRDPRAGLVSLMTATHDLLLDHPRLVPHFVARQGSRGPNATRLGETMRACLAAAGVDDPAAQDTAIRVLVVHAIGNAALGVAADGAPLPADTLRATYAAGLSWLVDGALGAVRSRPA